MPVHIGKRLKEILRHKQLSAARLGKMIGKSNFAVYSMFGKQYLHAALMKQLSEALSHDLFQYLYEPGQMPADREMQQKIQQMQQEIASLKKENEMLSEMNMLLKKR